MSFCIKCGNKLSDEAVFCGNCGYKIPEEEMRKETTNQPKPIADETVVQLESDATGETLDTKEEACSECSEQTDSQTKIEEMSIPAKDEQTEDNNAGFNPAYAHPDSIPKKKKPVLLISIVSILVIALFITSIFVFSNDQGSPKRTVNKYIEAVVDGDADEMIEIMYPRNILNRVLEERGTSYYEFEETLEDRYEYVEDEYRSEYGRNTRGRVRILNKERIDTEEIREKEEYLESIYGLDVNISDAMKLECEITISGSKDYRTEQDDITLYKIGRKWYILEIL